MALNGRDLKAERVRLGIYQKDLAARMGVSADKLSRLEDSARPKPDLVRRYQEALASLSELPSTGESPAA